MGIVYQLDKRSGITYAYENKAWWDKEKGQSRSKRTLIGRVDKETGKIVPTSGTMRKAAERKAEEARRPRYKEMYQEQLARVEELEAKVAELEGEVARVAALEDEVARLKAQIATFENKRDHI
ncbi:MAG: hypothetical protein Q4B54_13690 [Coriobacteriales bacterium]|nr:hypothetical protein [Coriobacteriales bacterium]